MVRGRLREDINYYLIGMGFLAASFLALLLPNFPIWVGFFMMSIGVKRISCGEAREKLQARILFLTYALSFWALVVFLAPYMRITFNPAITRILWTVTQAAQLYLVRQLVTWYAWLLEDQGGAAQATKYRKNLSNYTIIFCIAVLGSLLANIIGSRSIIFLCLLSFFICGVWMVLMLNRMPGLLALLAVPGHRTVPGDGSARIADSQYEDMADSKAEIEDESKAGYEAGDSIGTTDDEPWGKDFEESRSEQRKRGAGLDDEQDE